MDILNVKLKTLLSFVEKKYDAEVRFRHYGDGHGDIGVIYGKDNQSIILSWRSEGEREEKIMEYIFLNRI